MYTERNLKTSTTTNISKLCDLTNLNKWRWMRNACKLPVGVNVCVWGHAVDRHPTQCSQERLGIHGDTDQGKEDTNNEGMIKWEPLSGCSFICFSSWLKDNFNTVSHWGSDTVTIDMHFHGSWGRRGTGGKLVRKRCCCCWHCSVKTD